MNYLALSFVALSASACTIGQEQSFELTPGPTVTDDTSDVLFSLTNLGGNTAEELRVYRVTLDDVILGGGLFGCEGPGDAQLALTQDGGTPNVVDPGDVVYVREFSDGKNLRVTDNGTNKVINIMVLDPNQRHSEALTCTWDTVWHADWHIGG